MRNVVGVLGILAVLVLVPSVQAGSLTSVSPPHSRTVTIPASDYEAFSVNIATSWSLVVGVVVTSGGNIDVYVTPQTGYNEYTNPSAPSFTFLVSGTQENTRSYNKTLTTSGLYFIIVDNDFVTESGAQPSGSVTVQMYFGQSTGSFLLGLAVIAILAIVIIGSAPLPRRPRKAPPIPPPLVPPMAPPMAPPPLQPPQP